MKPRSGLFRFTAFVAMVSFTLTTTLQGKAFAAHVGSSTVSAGTASPQAATAVQSFQPDLFTGRATFSLPIVAPPGRRGLQPSISLNYSSGAGNGICGVGWSLDLPRIVRSTRHGVPRYDDQDIFELSLLGAQTDLIPIGAGEYRARDEELFLKIRFDGVRWEARDKQGTFYRFDPGTMGPSGSTLEWELVLIRDVLKNYISFSYSPDLEDTGSYLRAVDYTGWDGVPNEVPRNHIFFTYEPRPDVVTSLRSGARQTLSKRLKEIRVTSQDESLENRLVRIYRMEYTQSLRTERSLLASVTQVGDDGTSQLPPSRFLYYSDQPPAHSIRSNVANRGRAAWYVRKAGLNLGNVNFGCVHPYAGLPWGSPVLVDGESTTQSDLGCVWVMVHPNASLQVSGCPKYFAHAYTAVHVSSAKTISLDLFVSRGVGCLYVEDANGVRGPVDPRAVELKAGQTILHLVGYDQVEGFTGGIANSLKDQVDAVNPTPFIQPSLAGDFDGNGMTDVAIFKTTDGTWKVATAERGGSFVESDRNWAEQFGSSNSIPLLGDWDGGGTTDIAIFDNGDWRFARSSGRGFFVDEIPPVQGPTGTPIVGDFNGDSKTDIGTFSDGTWRVGLSTGNGFGGQAVWLSSSFNLDPLIGDFNGDGLTDVALYDKERGTFSIGLSTGRDFLPLEPWKIGDAFVWAAGSNPTTADFNGDGRSDLVAYDRTQGKVQVAHSLGDRFAVPAALPVPFGLRGENDQLQVGDFNGDALSDPAVFNPASGNAQMGLSEGTPSDLLRQIVSPLGGTTTLTYEPSTGVDNLVQHRYLPFVIPVVRQVGVENGLGWSATTTYLYSGGLYRSEWYPDDLHSGELIGTPFDTREFRGFGEVTVIDPEGNRTKTYFHQFGVLKGRPAQQEIWDANGRLFARTTNLWVSDHVANGVHFNRLQYQNVYTFEGSEAFRRTYTRLAYDAFGNPTEVFQEGDASIQGDERTTRTEYTYNPLEWLMGFPSHTLVLDSVDSTVAESWFYYDNNERFSDLPTKGLLTKEEHWLSTGPPNAVTTYAYDAYGNRIRVTDPLGRVTSIAFDSSHTFPVQATNPLGHTVSTRYDHKTGNLLSSTDPNGQTTRYLYDPLGRLVSEIGPEDTEEFPRVRYGYDLTRLPSLTSQSVKGSWEDRPIFYYSTYTYLDGLGRVIQIHAPRPDSALEIVTGTVEFGARGEVRDAYLPYFEEESDRYVPSDPDRPKVRFEYDPLGRLAKTVEADGFVTATTYGVGSVTGTDAGGNSTRSEFDAYGMLVRVIEPSTPDHGPSTTTYTYDAAGRLLKVVDAQGNVARMTYDSLGRKLSMEDPDVGRWSYRYDEAGNLIRQTDAKGQVLEFRYDALSRLLERRGRASAGTSSVVLATYTYDDPAKPFSVGRLSKITDPTGSTEFWYDRLGREIQTVKTISEESFTFQRSYDPIGRLTRLIYPDGTDLRYEYRRQGIRSIYSVNPGGSTRISYLEEAFYNAAGLPLSLRFGNDEATDYTYDPKTSRLEGLRTAGPTGALQEFHYRFDPVGNLTGIQDAVNTATQSFVYDQLNRLLKASGSYGDVSYGYDPLGNLIFKEGATLRYGLPGGSKPHAVTEVRRPDSNPLQLSYDPNGNLIRKGGDLLRYDLENHLVEVLRTQPVKTIPYDLDPGWNLITVPLDVEGRPVTEVLSALALGADYDQLSTHNAAGGRWESFVGDARFNEFEAFQAGRAYEIYVTNPSGAGFSLTGTTPATRSIQELVLGWNLIPSPVLEETPVGQAIEGLQAGADYDELLRYKPSTRTWESVSVCRPGESYWLHSLVIKRWEIPIPVSSVERRTHMVYDADGRRVQLTEETPTGAHSLLSVGGLYELLPGGVTRAHILFGTTRIATLERVASPDGTNLYFYHEDHLGSVNVVTDQTGKRVWLQEYAPFGSLSRAEGQKDLPHKFTGKRLDSNTGFYHYGARYYDPDLGRFIQPDTLVQAPSDPQTLNRYAYVRNNPLSYIDPTGHFSIKKFFKSVVQVATFAAPFLFPALAPVAPLISMASAMAITGLSGGNLGQIFQSGIMAGISSGLSALGSGVGESVGALAGSRVVGNVVGAGLGGFSRGAFTALGQGYSGSEALRAGFRLAVGSAGLAAGFEGAGALYRGITGLTGPNPRPGRPTEEAGFRGAMDLPTGRFADVNTIGVQGQGVGAERVTSLGDFFDFREGGPLSRFLNRIPGVNAVSKVHDTFQIRLGMADLAVNLDQPFRANLLGYPTQFNFGLRSIFNAPGMPVAAGVTYGAQLSGSSAISSIAESLFD